MSKLSLCFHKYFYKKYKYCRAHFKIHFHIMCIVVLYVILSTVIFWSVILLNFILLSQRQKPLYHYNEIIKLWAMSE